MQLTTSISVLKSSEKNHLLYTNEGFNLWATKKNKPKQNHKTVATQQEQDQQPVTSSHTQTGGAATACLLWALEAALLSLNTVAPKGVCSSLSAYPGHSKCYVVHGWTL